MLLWLSFTPGRLDRLRHGLGHAPAAAGAADRARESVTGGGPAVQADTRPVPGGSEDQLLPSSEPMADCR